ncbi:unnamed protein product, partial [marine sediment metagenome]
MTERGSAQGRPGKGCNSDGSPGGVGPAPAILITIHGSPPSKNDQRVVRFGKVAAIEKGQRSKDWEVAAWLEIRPQLRAAGMREPFEGPVRISGTVYYRTRSSDLDLTRIQ